MSEKKFIELLEELLADLRKRSSFISIEAASLNAEMKGKVKAALILLREEQ